MRSFVVGPLVSIILLIALRLESAWLPSPVPVASQESASPIQWLRAAGIIINVPDMKKAEGFYCGTLGFAVADRSRFPQEIVLKTEGSAGLTLRSVPRIRKMAATDTRVSFTLQVNDLDESITRLKAKQVVFLETQPRIEGVGKAISICDPFGHPISLMHQTIVNVEPFQEPKIYNFGFYLPEMAQGRVFYAEKLGFTVRSEKYLPLDLPLGHSDKTFGFMLHYRPGVKAIEPQVVAGMPCYTVVFEATQPLETTSAHLARQGVKPVSPKGYVTGSNRLLIADPFGNISEIHFRKSLHQ